MLVPEGPESTLLHLVHEMQGRFHLGYLGGEPLAYPEVDCLERDLVTQLQGHSTDWRRFARASGLRNPCEGRALSPSKRRLSFRPYSWMGIPRHQDLSWTVGFYGESEDSLRKDDRDLRDVALPYRVGGLEGESVGTRNRIRQIGKGTIRAQRK